MTRLLMVRTGLLLFAAAAVVTGWLRVGTTAAHADTISAVVNGTWSYTDDQGFLNILGDAVNVGPVALTRVTVVATLSRPDGSVRDREVVRALVQPLAPLGAGPFHVRFARRIEAGDVFSLAVAGVPTTEADSPFQITNRWDVRTAGGVETLGFLRTSLGRSIDARLVATFYDSDGHVVGLHLDRVHFTAGQSGRGVPFSVVMHGRNIATIRLQVVAAKPTQNPQTAAHVSWPN